MSATACNSLNVAAAVAAAFTAAADVRAHVLQSVPFEAVINSARTSVLHGVIVLLRVESFSPSLLPCLQKSLQNSSLCYRSIDSVLQNL